MWLPEAWYNKGCIHRLSNPRKRCASIVIMSVYLSVYPRGYLRNYTCDLYQIFDAWLDLPPAKGTKSAIYDCLVTDCN